MSRPIDLLTLLAGIALVSACSEKSTSGPAPATFHVDSVQPAPNSSADFFPAIHVYLSAAVDTTTVTTANLTLLTGATAQPRAVAFAGDRRSLTINAPVLPGATYTLRLNTAVKSSSGTALTVWQSSFTTRAAIAALVAPLTFLSPSRLVLDASGTRHAFILDRTTGALYYGRCASTCGVAASWQTAVIDTGSVAGDLAAAVDAGGRLHVIYGAKQTTGLRYASCASGCATAGGWARGTVDSLSNTGSYVALASGTALHAVYRGHDNLLHYATCSSGCDTTANWSFGTMPASLLNMVDIALAIDGQQRLHVVYNGQGPSTYPVQYETCPAACTQTASWQTLTLNDGGEGSDIAVDAAGVVHHAFYAGGIRYERCATACTVLGNWTAMTFDTLGTGSLRLSLAPGADGSLTIGYSGSGGALALGRCVGGCTDPAQWRHRVVNSGLDAGFAPSMVMDAQGHLHVLTGSKDGQYIE